MAISFQQRKLKFTFQFATASTDKNKPPETIEFENFRSSVEIESAGGYQFAYCRGMVFGINKQVMDRLTVINYQNLSFMRNVVTIEATDDNGRYCVVFKGEITVSQPHYQSAPDVPLEFEARSGVIGSLAPSTANSFPGSRKVSEIMETLSKELGVAFENNGVDSVLIDQSLSGTALEKVYKVKDSANIQVWFLPAENVLAIAPMGVPRKSETITISSGSGMVGWPIKRWEGVELSCLFNPSVRHGCKIKIESTVPACNGEWFIGSLYHSLSCNMPGGPWFTRYIANPVNLFIVNR